MIEIVPMAEEHINGVVTLEEATFSIPWTRADFEREVRENTMAIYYVALMDGRVVGYAGMWHVVQKDISQTWAYWRRYAVKASAAG